MIVTSEFILECRNLHKTFVSQSENVIAVRGIDFAVRRGEFVVIYGPSGSGKSTLLNLLAGLDRPDAGEVAFESTLFSSLTDRELTLIRRNRIGVIFQGFELVPVMSCYDNIEYPLLLRRVPRKHRRSLVLKTARLLGIDHLLARRPSQISGGQKQRVAAARTLVCESDVVLGDEISGSLDRRTALALFDALKAMCRERTQTYIIVTHDPELARYADRVLHMRDGSFVEDDVVQP